MRMIHLETHLLLTSLTIVIPSLHFTMLVYLVVVADVDRSL